MIDAHWLDSSSIDIDKLNKYILFLRFAKYCGTCMVSTTATLGGSLMSEEGYFEGPEFSCKTLH